MINETINKENFKEVLVKNLINKADQKVITTKKQLRHKLIIDKKNFGWSTNSEKIKVIRAGLPYASIEYISDITNIPVKHYLESLEIVQTTYNKKKKNKEFLNKQDSEFIVELTELYEFGKNVFNNEIEKFQRWLRKQNVALGNVKPESLFDSLTGINEVKKALNRIEYGNMA